MASPSKILFSKNLRRFDIGGPVQNIEPLGLIRKILRNKELEDSIKIAPLPLAGRSSDIEAVDRKVRRHKVQKYFVDRFATRVGRAGSSRDKAALRNDKAQLMGAWFC